MFKAKQIVLIAVAGLLLIGSTATGFGARGTLAQTRGNNITAQTSAAHHSRSSSRRHRRHKSLRRSKRVPNAASLKKESW